MEQDEGQRRATMGYSRPWPRLHSRMIGLALLWGFIDARDLEEAQAATSGQGSEGALRWLEAKGLLTPDQVQELALEARAVTTAPDEAPTSRFRIPDTESILQPDLEGPASGAFRLPGRPSGAVAPDVLVSSTLTAWGPFERLRLIGEGGMARIFRAHDPRLRRPVALKILRRDDPELHQRFIHEAQSQALVEHANVCRIFEAGEIEGQAYIAMQLIQGETLKAALTRLDLRQKAQLMVQVCEGVHAAHRRGLIHRDLKPANLMVEQDEDGQLRAYVLDFGLARQAVAGKGMTATGFVMGTVVYMSPEQARGETETMDRRADVYSLGASLYELLTGLPPYGAAEGMEALRKIIYEEPLPPRRRNPEVPRDLETIVLKCLEKDPARRYDTARALGDDLQRWLEGEPIRARPVSARERVGRFARRNKLAVGVAAAALLAVLVAGSIAVRSRLQASAQARWAQHFGQEAERLESLMRYGKLLPPHDIRRERRVVEARLQALERAIAGAGGLAKGPGAYAVGRTWLALGDARQARANLQRALEAGFMGAEVKYALGRACGVLYQRELEDAQRIPEPDARRARVRELEQGLKTEAIALLKAGRGSELEPPEYQEGQLALVDGRYQDAIRYARAAFERAPWFYEAKRLEAEAILAGARVLPRPAEAMARLREADASIEAARTIAPSDAGLLDLDSSRWHDLLGRLVRESTSLEPVVEAQGRVLQDWIRLEPANPLPRIRMAIACSEMASWRLRKNLGPDAWIGRAEGFVEEARRLAPSTPELSVAEIAYRRVSASHLESQGRDPVPVLQEAVRFGQEGRARAPASVPVNFALLRAYTQLIEALTARGQDCSGVFPRAREIAQDLLRRYPDVATYHGAYGMVLVEMASSEVQQGRSARALLEEAIPQLERAIRLSPDNPSHLYALANAHLVRAEFILDEGGSPAQDLAAARTHYQELMRQSPGNPFFTLGAAMTFEYEARSAVKQGKGAIAAIERSQALLREVEKAMPGYWMCRLVGARLDLVQARLSGPSGADSALHAGRALRTLEALARQKPTDPGIRKALKDARSVG
ncbi:MAG: protein kinase [Holophagaceae bacterium]